jgi:menaquinone-dependent protoporphyrinogen oxidase
MSGRPAPRPVLIAYATRYGSTHEVAERVAVALRAAGIEVEVRPVDDVASVRGYGAVVLGAPFYLARMLRSGRRFLRRRRRELGGVPLAVFVLGLEPVSRRELRLRRLLSRRRFRLEPFATAFFGGVVDGEKLRFRDKTPPIRRLLPGRTDTRDWDAIDVWARAVAEELKARDPEAPPAGRRA